MTLLLKVLKALKIIKTVEIEVYTFEPQMNTQPQPRKPLLNIVNRAGKFFIYTNRDGKQTRFNSLEQAIQRACIYSNNFSEVN